MRLRKLDERDIEGMFEWMSDPEIKGIFLFSDKLVDRSAIKEFINRADSDQRNRHFAVVNEFDVYQGTISLKNIDTINGKAEYAIAMRKCSHGTGIAKAATLKILEIGFEELKLNKIYLNVLGVNRRAVCFYDKLGFFKEGIFRRDIYVKGFGFQDIIWYSVLKEEFESLKYRGEDS